MKLRISSLDYWAISDLVEINSSYKNVVIKKFQQRLMLAYDLIHLLVDN